MFSILKCENKKVKDEHLMQRRKKLNEKHTWKVIIVSRK